MNRLNFKSYFIESEQLDTIFDKYLFFFKKDGEIFGAPEESRLVYARLKNPDEDESWVEDADFSAFDLKAELNGETKQKIFNKKDINSIEIVNPEELKKILK